MNEQDSRIPMSGYDPDTLADRLDALLPSESEDIFGAGVKDDVLLATAARLASAPRLEPSAAALARIQARMNEAMPASPVGIEPIPTPKTSRIVLWPVVALAAAAVTVLILLVAGRLLIITQSSTSDEQIAQYSTATAAAALAVMSETPPLTVTTNTPEITITGLTPTMIPISEMTIDPSPTPTEAASATETATMTLEVVATVEPSLTPSPVPTTIEPSLTPSPIPTTAAPEPSLTSSPIPVTAETSPTPSPIPTTALPVVTAVPADTIEPTATITPTPQPGNLILEGQIGAIDENELDIYGIRITLDQDDPLLEVLRVDDFVRVEGSIDDVDGILIVDAVTIELLTEDGEGIEVFVNPDGGGEVWRDSGDCSNPPPDWAPATGWRKRCEGSGGSDDNPGNSGGNNGGGNNGGGNNGGGNNGKGNDDDD